MPHSCECVTNYTYFEAPGVLDLMYSVCVCRHKLQPKSCPSTVPQVLTWKIPACTQKFTCTHTRPDYRHLLVHVLAKLMVLCCDSTLCIDVLPTVILGDWDLSATFACMTTTQVILTSLTTLKSVLAPLLDNSIYLSLHACLS